MSHRRRHFRSEQGQAAVEFALIVPVLLLLLLSILQGGIAFHNYLAVTDAARAAERQAIVARISGVTAADVQQAAWDAAPDLDKTSLRTTLSDPTDPTFTTSGSQLTVTVTYPYSINILGIVVASGNLTSRVTGRLE
ncbi:MAG: TadE/TadG family type IV pilus assembly protein [Actinomycetota bacterium]